MVIKTQNYHAYIKSKSTSKSKHPDSSNLLHIKVSYDAVPLGYLQVRVPLRVTKGYSAANECMVAPVTVVAAATAVLHYMRPA